MNRSSDDEETDKKKYINHNCHNYALIENANVSEDKK